MGIRLMVEVLDHAPADLTPTERLVLVAIAEAARDETREGWPGMDQLAHRTGLTSAAVSKTLQRLARREPPLEVRVAIAKGHDGRPVFAREGRRTTYRIPPLRADQCPPSEGGPQSTLDGSRADHGPVEGGPPSAPEGGPPSAPSPQIPQEIPSSPGATRARSLVASYGATDDETTRILEKITRDHAPRSLDAYVTRMAAGGDLAALVDEHAAERRRATIAAEVARLRTTDPCRHGVPGGEQLHPTGGEPLCPQCRMLARTRGAAA